MKDEGPDTLETIRNLMKPAELHPDLKPYLITREDLGMPGIYHPLFYSVPHVEQLNNWANTQYARKKEALKELRKEKRWNTLIHMYERPYRVQGFIEVKEHLTDDQYWRYLGDVWGDSENIWQNFEIWLELFQECRTQTTQFMDKTEQAGFKKLPEVLTIYRGYLPRKNRDGLSWTLDRSVADWFARRYGQKGKVAKRVVRKSDVFAYITGRKEEEIVIRVSALYRNKGK